MSKQADQKNAAKQQQSGSNYHKEHASNVPDYGHNDMDPNAKNASNIK